MLGQVQIPLLGLNTVPSGHCRRLAWPAQQERKEALQEEKGRSPGAQELWDNDVPFVGGCLLRSGCFFCSWEGFFWKGKCFFSTLEGFLCVVKSFL